MQKLMQEFNSLFSCLTRCWFITLYVAPSMRFTDAPVSIIMPLGM